MMAGRAVALITSVRASMARGDTPQEAAVEVREMLADVTTRDEWTGLCVALVGLSAGLLPDDYDEAQEVLQFIALQLAQES